MQQINKKELLEILDNYLKKDIMLKISKFIKLKIILKNFEYKIDNDQIHLQSNVDKNYVTFNINNINFIGKEENKIVFHIEDGKDTVITIEKKDRD